ncbi:hypothetical protein [Micromonospora aurantiaca (nom. illeg.)]|uniref:hypothetical protein n=1 Tax=Micromonospora aurantiaca (nom. illeg.) TaxID=47850 RepID=UPI00379204B8
MSRRATMRPARPVTLAVAIENYPDFDPSDYATAPAPGWTAATLWDACWTYADVHAEGSRGVAQTAFRDFARAYDRAQHLAPTSTRSVVRQDVEARLRGVDFTAGPVETA